VFEPADTGFSNTTIPSGGATFVNGNFLPWVAAHAIRAVSIRIDRVNLGTPYNLFLSSRDFDGQTALSTNKQTLVSAMTNNPVPTYVNVPRPGSGNAGGDGSTGTILAIGRAELFQSPYIRFTLLNNDPAVNITGVFMTVFAWT
jgi:hypothetical protein